VKNFVFGNPPHKHALDGVHPEDDSGQVAAPRGVDRENDLDI
jgi:hypothetical protein